jgi:hypothetical protein
MGELRFIRMFRSMASDRHVELPDLPGDSLSSDDTFDDPTPSDKQSCYDFSPVTVPDDVCEEDQVCSRLGDLLTKIDADRFRYLQSPTKVSLDPSSKSLGRLSFGKKLTDINTDLTTISSELSIISDVILDLDDVSVTSTALSVNSGTDSKSSARRPRKLGIFLGFDVDLQQSDKENDDDTVHLLVDDENDDISEWSEDLVSMTNTATSVCTNDKTHRSVTTIPRESQLEAERRRHALSVLRPRSKFLNARTRQNDIDDAVLVYEPPKKLAILDATKDETSDGMYEELSAKLATQSSYTRSWSKPSGYMAVTKQRFPYRNRFGRKSKKSMLVFEAQLRTVLEKPSQESSNYSEKNTFAQSDSFAEVSL